MLIKKLPSIKVNVLIYKEGNEWIAHCLQMDIVATNTSKKAVEDDIISLIKAHCIYAIENDNLENIFKPAPSEVWGKIGFTTKCEIKKISFIAPKIKEKTIPPIKEVEFCFA
jgi:hypothetical protein